MSGRDQLRCARTLGRAALGAVLLVLAATAAHAASRLSLDAGDSPSLGPADAPVTVFEFVDYQ